MIGERKLVALVAGHDAGLIAYASMLHRIHARAAARLLQPAASIGDAAGASDASAAHVTFAALGTPGEVRYVEAPRDRTLGRLLALSAQDDIEALLVPESVGRDIACRLSRSAACSVWFVPEQAPLRLGRFLVPVDFSVRAAEASLNSAVCDVLHIRVNDAVLTYELQAERRAREAALAYAKFIEPIDCLNVSVTPLFEESTDIARTIVRTAENRESDLIVLASRGRSTLAGFLRPSLVEQVIRTSRVPVLILKHFVGPLGLFAAMRHRPAPALPCN